MLDFIFSIIVLIFSVVIHEVAHGYAAYLLGDKTALYAGRLTLNPLKHLEWFGSFILPVISYATGGILLGWAKPVPYNPYNLKNTRWGEALVAVAGPASNGMIALVFGLCVQYGQSFLSGGFITMALMITIINIVLMVFNLVPIPPLDGSKILFAVVPSPSLQGIYERYGFFILIIFIFFGWAYLSPIINTLVRILTGFSPM
jgi:Zn-dependent protease